MDKIAVIDFGSQYAHLIANRVRRLGVFAEILLPDEAIAKLKYYKGIILSGGPQSVYERHAPTIDKRIFSLGIPILGLCYGHQLIAHLLGGKVSPGNTKEYGLAKLTVIKKLGILKGVPKTAQVWMSHGDIIAKLPPYFIHIGSTEDCKYAAIADPEHKIFSSQFHIEVTHTKQGMKMLNNFLKLCGTKREWKMERFLKEKIEYIKHVLSGRKVFLLVSGGVDSTVAYVFLSKALGTEKVYGLFIDTGLLRKNEARDIRSLFKRIGIKNFHAISAKEQFINALKDVINPEDKRRIIGNVFLKVQAATVHKLHLNPKEWVLGQGTIYPDTIESAGTKYADRIKTHHNRVPEIEKLIKENKLIEPLAELYKDEVRGLGAQLGLPKDIVWKHPFPGPGLAVRMLCAEAAHMSPSAADQHKDIANYIAQYGLESAILPIQSVGVQGDSRTYRNPLVLWGKQHSFHALEKLSTSLTNRFSSINRVCLLLAPQSIRGITLIPSTITARRIRILQDIDYLVMQFIKKHRMERKIWQFPSILIPVGVNGSKKETVALRPVCSDEAMTANFYKMNRKLLEQLTLRLAPMVSAVLYDITNKPPGTIEWE